MESAQQRQQTGMGRIAGLLAEVRNRRRHLFRISSRSTLRLKLYNPRVYAKLNLRLQNQIQEPICLGFVGSLF